ncbi:MAG: hypothetical protein HQ518_05780 [Rhodopirellula sp.]|nr:hypothetical protein [Rhodopirellula sp.]
MSGLQLREELGKEGHRKTLAAFYQMMSRMEDSGIAEGWYEHSVEDGQPVKQRKYKITGDGDRAWRRQQEFYIASSRLGLGLAGAGGI